MGIPEAVAGDVLYENDHTCCICNEKGKDVQIHHIDGDDRNNVLSNLAVLCLDCHSKATGLRGLGRKYSPLEVEKYKRNWEFTVKERRKLHRHHAPSKTSNWVEIETARVVYELGVTKDAERAKELLELLNMYYIFEGNSSFALDKLHDMVPFIWSPQTSALVAEHLLHYFWHLPGPQHAKMNRKDIKDLKAAIDVLEWIGKYEAVARGAPGPIASSLNSLESIFETANSYSQRKLQDAAIAAIKSIRKEASEQLENSDPEITRLVEKADVMIARLVAISRGTQPSK